MRGFLMEDEPGIEVMVKVGRSDALRWELCLTGDVNSK
ncbi:hypothetical protein GOY19_04130 [Aeromonas hydrophila]|nr:hypothetical protein [Aeromonas hydrophila]MBW3813577.1 hypothetical protein [Aeromonas hydrophila]